MTHDKISLLILHWKRSENVKRILDAEVSIPVIDEVIVFNSNPETVFTYAHPKVKVINSSFDFGLRRRLIMGALAKNDCLVFQDDDILLNEEVFAAFLNELTQDPERAYSLYGRNPTEKNKYNVEDAYGEVEIILPGAACMHKKCIPVLLEAEYDFFYDEPDYPSVRDFPAEDLFMSYCLYRHYGKKHRALKLRHENLAAPDPISGRRDYLRVRTVLMRKCQEFFFGTADRNMDPFKGVEFLGPMDGPQTGFGRPVLSLLGKEPASPRKLRLVNRISPGDVLMATAAVRDLHLQHRGKFITDIDSSCPQLWENNPYVTKLDKDDPAVEAIEMHYPLIHQCNEGPYHFIHGYRLFLEEKLGIKINPTKFWGDIHFRPDELHRPSIVHEHFTGWDTPYWLICTGGKTDYTAKWWIPEYAQQVVDHFKDRIQFVQFGGGGVGHYHPPLQGVIDLVGWTDLRQLMLLMYHASGVITPVSFAMHLAAATPAKPGLPKRKPCVVTAGGREPSVWEAYTHHIFIHANGQLFCSDNGGCWKSRTVPLNDADDKDKSLCINTVEFNGRKVQRCMRDLVTAEDVIGGIERYYKCGALQYLPPGLKTTQGEWEDRITKKAHAQSGGSSSASQDAAPSRLSIAIIASGEEYQRAAGFAAATYRAQMKDHVAIKVYVPENEGATSELAALAEKYDFLIKKFPLRLIKREKFTSQLKCQGFLAAFDDLGEGEMLLIVDADTYCRKLIRFPADVVNEIRNGKLGLVQDVTDRHENRSGVPWFIPEDRRLPYVNSGVILAGKKAVAFFEHLHKLASDPRFLAGPFNDQNLINFALGMDFRDRLFLLNKAFNGMSEYFGEDTIIGHVSGGAGNIGPRSAKHREECLKIIGETAVEQPALH